MFLTRNVLRKYYSPDPGTPGGTGTGGTPPNPGNAPGSGGAGGGQPGTPIPAEYQAAVQAMIDAATAPLRENKNQILNEKKTLQTQLQQFEGIDPEAVKTIMKRFGDDEEQSLIKAGKIDEVLNRRTERLNADWQRKIEAEKNNTKKIEAKANKLAARAVSDAIAKAATKAGAHPEALEDIVLRAQSAGFTINEDGDVVALRDNEVVFGKDGKTPLSALEWVEDLRNSAKHLWPVPQGSGASGSGNAGRAGNVDLSKLSPEARMSYAREHNMTGQAH